MKLENKQGITKIVMHPFADCLCAIGQDWYHIDFDVTFIPNKYYPDYMDVTRFVSTNISGKEMNIEDAVNCLGGMLYSNYDPTALTVRANINKATTHFPVEVEKTY